MTQARTSLAVAAALLASACSSSPPPAQSEPQPVVEHRSDVIDLGTHYDSPIGSLCVINVQHEYRVIRCIPSGPIAGCYDDVFVVPEAEVAFNRWLPVAKVPGLDVSIVSPREVAFRLRKETGTPQK